jgi:hypothetical protein
MLVGCGDCEPSASCDYKVLVAAISPTSAPDGTGSYCPHVYTCTDGTPVTTCASIGNILNWLAGQVGNFMNDSLYPWNTYATALFTDGSSTTPASFNAAPTVPGKTSSTGGPSYFITYGGPSLGSGYTVDYSTVALDGPSAGNLCAFAQLVAMRMSGNLFITPYDVPEVTESCLATAISGICSASGAIGSGVYYIPMPPYDLCSVLDDGSIQMGYVPSQTGNSDECLPAYTGGAYNTCQTPDPFFGSDPP